MPKPENVIDALIKQHEAIRNFLLEQGEVTLANDSDTEFRKVLILSIASFFEHQITEAVRHLAEQSSSPRIYNLVKTKAISRQYHTYFDWKEGKNVNSFTGLFGGSVKDEIAKEIKQRDLTKGMKLFLELGQRRNLLVHENFAAATVEWSINDIIEKYEKSLEFVLFLSGKLQAPEP